MLYVIHLTTVHPRSDPRIRYKEAESSARRYPGGVALFVMDGVGDEHVENSSLQIEDLGKPSRRRLGRAIFGNWRAFRRVRKASPAIVHFHDPELIPAALLLKLAGIKVIYDIHEDVPKQVLGKTYIKPALLRRLSSSVIRSLERFAVNRFDAAVVVVESIARRFPEDKTVLVRNFPRADIMKRSEGVSEDSSKFIINYSGSLTRARGIVDLVKAMEFLPDHAELQLFGKWHPATLQDECKALPGWSKCRFLGRVSHETVVHHMQKAHLGVHLTHDIPNYIGGLATKVFEYLSLGVPVLTTETGDRREIYGDLVSYTEPENPEATAEAIRGILDDYERVSNRAQENVPRVREIYSWENEAARLLELYDRLLSSEASS